MARARRPKLGPRVCVEMGDKKVKGKTVKNYSFMTLRSAQGLGLEPLQTLPTRTGPRSKVKRVIRGSKAGSTSFVGIVGTGERGNRFSFPGGGATIAEVIEVLRKGNKAHTVVSPDGRSYPTGIKPPRALPPAR